MNSKYQETIEVSSKEILNISNNNNKIVFDFEKFHDKVYGFQDGYSCYFELSVNDVKQLMSILGKTIQEIEENK